MLNIDQALLVRVLSQIAADPILINKLIEHMGTMPNIPSATIGGAMLWDNVVEVKGWRLQYNWYFDSYRVLDSDNVPLVWSKDETLLQAFQSFDQSNELSQYC